jgi:hypothetical protein
MKEQEQITTKETTIKWPNLGSVEIGANVDFVYIMRKDIKFTMSSISQRMSDDYLLDENMVLQTLSEEYDIFFSKLADAFVWGFSAKGNFELHFYDPDILDNDVRTKSEGKPIVSLDPLMSTGVYEQKVSRGYYLGGIADFGQVPRPGSESLASQAKKTLSELNGDSVTIIEDDTYSGESIIASLNKLENQGLNIYKIVPGIQVGKPSKLSELGLTIDPSVEYSSGDNTNIFDKVDLGDPRDYLLGASGLVVKLPSGEFGRVPYLFPFVSTAARASMPQELEGEFALKALIANLEFFKRVEAKIGKPILLKHMDQYFVNYMNAMFGFDQNTPMEQVVMWSINNKDILWEKTKILGQVQERIESLDLPKNIIFVDLNGTLIPEELGDRLITEKDSDLLKQVVVKMKSKGLAVGLCSDSPLPQLLALAEELGLDGPTIAENGNILFYNGQTFIVNALLDIKSEKTAITNLANQLGHKQTDDCLAIEFGGKKIDTGGLQWGFGANREASVTVFGSSQLIKLLGENFQNKQGISVDCSPEYGFFAIHPGDNYRLNKGGLLQTLEAFGYNILMIGNSMSDWVDPSTGVQCAFVNSSRITQEVKQQASYISSQNLINGVVDIMENIQ